MKTYLLIFCFLMAFIPVHLTAQGDKEDVIYLKNGSIYRGTIIEQIPNVSYKIEIAGGSIIMIRAEDVTKITKEDKTDINYAYVKPQKQYEFHYRQRTWFLQGQALAEIFEMGFRLAGGYKFNQFGYLGLGFGIDQILSDLHFRQDYSGAYVPLYVYYAGDLFKKHITPFYSIEAGYAFRPQALASYSDAYYSGEGPLGGTGGFMAGVGFGVRFYSRRRVHFDLSAHLDMKMATEHYVTQIYVSNGSYNSYYSTHEVLLNPGLRFGIGF